MATPLVLGLVGGGTVGGGVYDIVEYTHKDFFKSLGAEVTVKKASPSVVRESQDNGRGIWIEIVDTFVQGGRGADIIRYNHRSRCGT